MVNLVLVPEIVPLKCANMDGDIGHCRYSKLGSGACENQVTPKATKLYMGCESEAIQL